VKDKRIKALTRCDLSLFVVAQVGWQVFGGYWQVAGTILENGSFRRK
jgi:hypothetical protein